MREARQPHGQHLAEVVLASHLAVQPLSEVFTARGSDGKVDKNICLSSALGGRAPFESSDTVIQASNN